MDDKTIKTVELAINNEQARNKIKELSLEIEVLRKKKEEAMNGPRDAYKNVSTSLDKALRQMENMQSRSVNISKVLGNISGSNLRDLKNTLSQLNRQLSSRTVERNSDEWKALQRAVYEVRKEIQKVNNETAHISDLGHNISSFGIHWVGITTVVRNAAAAIQQVVGSVMGLVDAYAQMQEAESNVRKYTGLTMAQVDDLNESFKKMDTRTPREKLNALAADAGRLGITGKQDILDFVSAADQINIALGEDLGTDAVKNIGKLSQMFGEDNRLGLKQAMLSVGSAINQVAQSSSASEPYLLDFTARVAGAAQTAHISAANLIGFASVMDQNMLQSERASTAFQNLLTKTFWCI